MTHRLKIIFTSILMIVCFFIIIQIYLYLKMSAIEGFPDALFYTVTIVLGCISIELFKKHSPFLFLTLLFLITLIAIKFFFTRIESYTIDEAISKGQTVKENLRLYKKKYAVYPDDLNILYGNSPAPAYKIGLLKYSFSYHKSDSTYKLYFISFGGKDFCSGEFGIWTFCD